MKMVLSEFGKTFCRNNGWTTLIVLERDAQNFIAYWNGLAQTIYIEDGTGVEVDTLYAGPPEQVWDEEDGGWYQYQPTANVSLINEAGYTVREDLDYYDLPAGKVVCI